MDAPGYSWQRLPEQKLLGGVRGEGGREGGRGRDSASDVIGSPSASQGRRPNLKNQSGAGERPRDVRRAGRRGREVIRGVGPGPAAAASSWKIAATLPLARMRELPGEPVSYLSCKKILGCL